MIKAYLLYSMSFCWKKIWQKYEELWLTKCRHTRCKGLCVYFLLTFKIHLCTCKLVRLTKFCFSLQWLTFWCDFIVGKKYGKNMKNYSLPDVAVPIPRAFVLILKLESPHIRVSWGYSQIIIWVAHLHQHLFG